MNESVKQEIDYSHFQKVDIRVGTILQAEDNIKARVPAYILTIDFGELGVKTSSAQITKHYQPEQLINKQVIAVVNFPVKRIAGVKSEVLVLGCVPDNNNVILLEPNLCVPNGVKIA